jgi:hypothetical protein
MSKASDPGQENCIFKSFSRKYKKFLLKNAEYGEFFRVWYYNTGKNEAFARFNEPLANAYCEYVENEVLKNCIPKIIEEPPVYLSDM